MDLKDELMRGLWLVQIVFIKKFLAGFLVYTTFLTGIFSPSQNGERCVNLWVTYVIKC